MTRSRRKVHLEIHRIRTQGKHRPSESIVLKEKASRWVQFVINGWLRKVQTSRSLLIGPSPVSVANGIDRGSFAGSRGGASFPFWSAPGPSSWLFASFRCPAVILIGPSLRPTVCSVAHRLIDLVEKKNTRSSDR